MMGSPYYYDIFFDDGSGDPFHDCMWSGICTCCIQLLNSDLKESSAKQFSINDEPLTSGPNAATNFIQASADANHHHLADKCQHPQIASACGALLAPTQQHHHHHHHHHQLHHQSSQLHQHLQHQTPQASDSTLLAASTTTATSTIPLASTLTAASTTTILASAAATALTSTTTQPVSSSAKTALAYHESANHTKSSNASPVAAQSPTLETNSSASSSNSTTSSNSTSPKPVRRREHNDSERKRRDHLRNAFNFLRDQVPRFKSSNKKPPRIQILHEATKYVQFIIKESQDLDKRLAEERAKNEQLSNFISVQ